MNKIKKHLKYIETIFTNCHDVAPWTTTTFIVLLALTAGNLFMYTVVGATINWNVDYAIVRCTFGLVLLGMVGIVFIVSIGTCLAIIGFSLFNIWREGTKIFDIIKSSIKQCKEND